jgi:hypothetical protein
MAFSSVVEKKLKINKIQGSDLNSQHIQKVIFVTEIFSTKTNIAVIKY